MASESVDVMTELPTEISRNALKELIENNPRFAGKEVIVEYDKASGKGDNYSGDLFRIKIRHNSDTWSIVAKFPSFMKTKNEENRPMFHREDLFYQDIYPIFKKFQEERGIFGTAGFYEVPSCVKSGMIEYNEFIFLEDLKVTGFEMYDRFKNVTVDYANETMKILGKLHALSFAIKDQDGNLLKPYTSIQDVLTRGKMTTSLNVWYKILTQKAMDALVDFDEPEVVQKVQKLLETPFKELFENAVEGFTEYPVFFHGDCWNNNVMYRTENEVAVEARLLDWQIMRYGSPVLDMLYYIFCCTTKEFRDEHYEEVLNTYYTSLSTFMTKLGSNPEKLYPRKAFEKELVKFGKFGMLMAMFVLPIFVSTIDEIPETRGIDKNTSADEIISKGNQFGSGKALDVYKKRIRGVFIDSVRLNYI